MKRFLSVLLILLLLSVPVLAADEDAGDAGTGGAAETASETGSDNGGAASEEVPEEEGGGPEAPEGGAETGNGNEDETGAGEEDASGEAESTYVPGQFSDVAEDRWYGVEGQGVIRRVWDLGLMVGMGDGTFRPDGYLRLSEAIKLAAMVRSRAEGDEVLFLPSTPWYQTYLDYAEATGIVEPGEFPDLTAYATRGEMAHILAGALTEDGNEHINAIFAIPDVISSSTPAVTYSADILRLYRAGVLWGDEGSHAFRPDDCITRAEAAAAVIRLALPEERQRLELLPVSGAAGPIEDVYLLRDTGERLSLGYHTWEEFFAFIGEDTAREAADLYLSLDRDETAGYPVFGEEGSLILAEYPQFTLEFLIPDRNPMGIYVFRIESAGEETEDSRGVRIGMALRSLLNAFGNRDLQRESGSADPVWFSCVLEDRGVILRYAVSWDGRVSSISMACVQPDAD